MNRYYIHSILLGYLENYGLLEKYEMTFNDIIEKKNHFYHYIETEATPNEVGRAISFFFHSGRYITLPVDVNGRELTRTLGRANAAFVVIE